MAKNLIVILGPTASGKTRLAARLACDLNGEVISADSRQVYQRMNIGTGKDLREFEMNGRVIPYHMIDVAEPKDEFNLFEFQKRFYSIFRALRAKNTLPILVGGTGLYLESVLCNYDLPEAPIDEEQRKTLLGKTKGDLQKLLCELKPQMHNRTDLDDAERLIRAIEIELARQNADAMQRKKPEIDAVVFGIQWERSALRERITRRLEERLEQGMVEEVSHLHETGLSWAKLDSFGLEYRFISRYLQNQVTFHEMKSKLNTAIHQFAKRQETWFRRMEKKGVAINWIPGGDYPLLKESVMKALP